MPKSRRTLYLTDGPFEELQRLSPNMSQEVDGFIRKRVEELTGHTTSEDINYQTLKERHNALLRQVETMKKALSQNQKQFEEANKLVNSLGIDKDFSNAVDVIPRFIKTWKGDAAYAQEYITLIEASKERKALTKRLLEIRKGPGSQTEDVATQESQAGVPVACP